MPNISHNLAQIRARIHSIAKKHNINPDTTRLLAVSKTQPASALIEAYNAQQRDFGENYAQELEQKARALAHLDIIWHFIGPIQSNKTRVIAEYSHWVHSIDRCKIAERLNKQRPSHLPPIQVCIQVNIDDEDSKSGIAPCELDALIECIRSLPNLHLRGLMAIPSKSDPAKAFRTLQELAQQHHLHTLSMGMSGDIEEAITAGSTIVRVGTAIFGARQPQQHTSTTHNEQ